MLKRLLTLIKSIFSTKKTLPSDTIKSTTYNYEGYIENTTVKKMPSYELAKKNFLLPTQALEKNIYSLCNPIKQNKTHISCLSQHLNLNSSKFIPIHVFRCINFNVASKCENVIIASGNYIEDIVNYIETYNSYLLSDNELLNIGQVLWYDMIVSDEIKDNHKKKIEYLL